MKYVIMIQSNPQPWGHPTSEFVAEHQALPAETRERLGRDFEEGFSEMMQRGEFVHAEEIARLFCGPGETIELRPVMVDGPEE